MPPAPIIWSPFVIQSIISGDLPKLQAQLADFKYDLSRYEEVPALVEMACKQKQTAILSWLLNERFPEWRTHLRNSLVAIWSGPAIFEIWLNKWPELLEWDLGHHGNPLGHSMFMNDKAMVEYLLRRGADPNAAHFSMIKFYEARGFNIYCERAQNDIIELLLAHGFKLPEGAEWPRKKRSPKQRCIVL